MKTLMDPVCGMTVGESALRAEGYDNVAFCAEGCRRAFLADPPRYITTPAFDRSRGGAGPGGHHGCGCGHHGGRGHLSAGKPCCGRGRIRCTPRPGDFGSVTDEVDR